MPNFSRTKVLISIIAVLLLTNIAMLIFVVGTRDHRRKRGDEGNRGPGTSISIVLEQKVGFTREQMDKVKELRGTHREKMHSLFEDIRLAKISFYGHLGENEVNDSVFNTSGNAIAEKQKAIDLQAFKNLRELRALCTPEQLPKYDSIMPGVLENMWFPARRGNNDKKKDSSHHQK
jgi:Spy/CpxP family protein refolding chaperone